MGNANRYSNTVLETLGLISGFNLSEFILEEYSTCAFPRLKNSTTVIISNLELIKEITPEEASQELQSLSPVIPILSKFKMDFTATLLEEPNFASIKQVTLEFIESVLLLYSKLQEFSEGNKLYELSLPVISQDWDRVEDQHWDSYESV